MAYYSLGAYDATVSIPGFMGLQQYGPGMDGDIRYAEEEANVETPAGVLQPQAAPEILTYSFAEKIETLAHLHRRWYTGDEDPELLIAATGGKLYALRSFGWMQLPFPSGVTSYGSNVWSCAAYEINPSGSSSSVDVLLMSNAVDGMIMVRGDNYVVTKVTTPKKFGVIERYAERIWGGAIQDDPDMLVYSAPYDPTDWEQNEETPEDGAGDISQPSWDGDSFTALRSFGSQLIAFKKHRVWRILGTDPGEYTFKEQFGGGAPYFNTIAIDTERIFLAEKDGLSVYDGLSVSPIFREQLEDLWRRVNRDAMDQACAALFKQRYYLALPVDGSSYNNCLLIYSIADGTLLYYDSISIESFLVTEEKLYATSATLPGKVLAINWNSWETGTASEAPVRWVSPWMSLQRKNMKLGGYDVYFQPEVQSDPVTIRFSIQTEKKIKSKKYTVQPLSPIELQNSKNYKVKKLHFGGAGRRFRLIIETDGGSAPWRLIGGVQIVVETDPD